MAKKEKLDKKYKIMSLNDMARLTEEFNMLAQKNVSPWLRQFDIGSKCYRVIQISNGVYFLNRDGQNLLFDPETKDVVDLGDMMENGINKDADIPWNKMAAWVERQGKSKEITIVHQQVPVEIQVVKEKPKKKELKFGVAENTKKKQIRKFSKAFI
jgi:hypothetical protein